MSSVYILYSETTDRYYIGSTTDLGRRIKDHNYGNTSSTKYGRPWSCVFCKEFENLEDARAIEKKIKKYKSRVILKKIIDEGCIKA